MSEIADELSTRATPSYVKARAKQTVMRKGGELKDRAMGSPWTFSALGALLGGVAGSWFIRRRRDEEERFVTYDEQLASRYEEAEDLPSGDVKSTLGSAVEGAQEKLSTAVHGAKDFAADKLDSVRESIPVARDRAAGWTRELIAERPLVVALAAVGLGALASLLIPVSDVERKALAPAKGKVTELADQLQQKVQETVEGAPAAQSSSLGGPISPEPAIH